jgi:Spy/CpxP family protein refolding chaperone
MLRFVLVLLVFSLGSGALANSAVIIPTWTQEQRPPSPPPPDNPPTGPPAGEPTAAAAMNNEAGHKAEFERRLALMAKRYKLTVDQQNQIKPVLEDEQEQMESMSSDTSASREDKRSKMVSLHRTTNEKIEALLTDEPKEKFEADQQKMQERRAEHMKDGDVGPGDAGQPPTQPQ